MPLLHPGDAFPEMLLGLPGGKSVTVPEAFSGDFGVMLFYRGAWCPYCNAQLRAFQRASAALTDAGIRVAALSVDDEATTTALIDKLSLAFPVGFGADAGAVTELTGAFVNPGPVYLQSTGFVLDPDGKVVVSVYSSGAIGRLVPEDVTGLVRSVRREDLQVFLRTGRGGLSALPATATLWTEGSEECLAEVMFPPWRGSRCARLSRPTCRRSRPWRWRPGRTRSGPEPTLPT